MKLFRILTVFFFLFLFLTVSQAVTIVENGMSKAVIVLDTNADDDEQLAANELQKYIAKISGANLEIVNGIFAENIPVIMVGQNFLPEKGKEIQKKGSDPSSFAILVQGNKIFLGGLSPEGTLFAAYEFLEKLGFRWYFPGELGTVIPKSKTISVPDLADIQIPSFGHRNLQGIPTKEGNWKQTTPWCKRQKLGGQYFNGCHGIPCLPKADINNDPDLFALVNGKRTGPQMCVSNPELIKRAVAYACSYIEDHPEEEMFGMGPEDGAGFCECESCKAIDGDLWDPFNNCVSLTDRYIWFFNKVLDEVHKKHPGKKLAFYIYHNYQLPPVKHTPNKSIVGAYAPINLCRIHGMSNPICPDRSFYKYLMEEWGKLLPEIYERGYFYNLAAFPVPFSKIHAIRDEFIQAYNNNVRGWRVEVDPSWASCGLTLYVASELMWNVNTDVGAVVAEFYDKFFGPAAKPMGKWLDMVDDAYANTDCHVGGTYGLPFFFPPEKIKEARKLIKKAEKLSRNKQPYNERVRIYSINFDMLDHYLKMWQARLDMDFKKSYEEYKLCQKGIDTLANEFLLPTDGLDLTVNRRNMFHYRYYAPLLDYPSAGFLERFLYDTVSSGYKRTVSDGKLVSKVDNIWDFQLDYDSIGENVNWYADGQIGGNWHKINTDLSWSDEGYYYYKGHAWYRTTVKVDSKYKGKKLNLWFGGVDELAKVWINGKLLGESFAPEPSLPGVPKAFAPFEFDITEHVRFNKLNTIAVKITNNFVDEIGTGGIISPVMIWTPDK